MKILICGKGGSGKSTLASLLAFDFVAMGRKVIMVDTDESNRGLHRLLGTDAPRDIMERVGGKRTFLEKVRKDGNKEVFDRDFSLDMFEEEYVKAGNGIRLVSIGKIHDFGEGCACPMGMLAKRFISKLQVGDDEVAIVDTEAGIEHFGRSVEEGVDAIIIVIDPSYESLILSKQVSEMIRGQGIPVYHVLNKVSKDISDRIRESIDPSSIIGELPLDPEILLAGLEGRKLEPGHPTTASIAQVLSEKM